MKVQEVTQLQEIQVSYKRQYGKEAVGNSFRASEICRQAYSTTGANICLKEYMFIILLNRSNEVIGFHKLSEGGINGTVADVRLAYSIAIKSLASGIILCHNHPSGNLKPSQADTVLTKKFKEAGKIMDVTLLDHLILTETDYFSFADEGIL